MPICYNISPALNMVIYVCKGSITAAEIFKTADLVYSDERRKPNLITVLDLLSAVENIHVKDIYDTIEQINVTAEKENGLVPEPIVLLSRSNGIHDLVNAIQLLPSKVPFKMDAFYTMEDAIISLGLLAVRQEILHFWQECISLSENS